MPLIRKPSLEAAPATPAADPFVQLTAEAADARRSAARALASLPGGVAALAAAAGGERDVTVREAIFTSLARAATPQSVAAAAAFIRANESGLRTAALDALRAMPQAVEPQLSTLLSDPDPDVRLLSCEIARSLPAPVAARLLCDLLDREDDANVCASAVEVLAETAGPEAAPTLQRCLARFDGEPFLGFAIKVVLERVGSQTADHD